MYRQTQHQASITQKSPRWWRFLSVIVVALFFGVLMQATLLLAAPPSSPAVALSAQSQPNDGGDDKIEIYGIVITRPEGTAGTWVISGTEEVTFSANEETDTEGDLSVGACVRVEALTSNLTVAIKIRPESAEHCDGGDDSGGDDSGGDDALATQYGVVMTRPVESVGEWIIGAHSYTVTESTILEGLLETGVCVEVYTDESAPTVAVKIEAKDALKCNDDDSGDGSGDDSGDDNGGPHDGDILSRYGVIVTRPVESVGSWVIGEKTFSVTESTVLEGALEVGTCVEVKVLESEPTTAIKIEAKDAFKCNDDDDDDDHGDDHDADVISRYGVIVTRPVESVGSWVIGEKTFSVTESTVLEGALEVGTCVEVKALKSEPTTAIKIEAKDALKCNDSGDDDSGDDDSGDDDSGDGDGNHERGDKYFGIIEEMPDQKIGLWVIGGETFSVTERTKLDFDHGRLAVGICAKVETVARNSLIAKEIESENNYKCRPRDDDNARGQLFGLIEELPDDLSNGIWAIGGMRFVVSPTTELITKGGTFSVGVLVKVDFTSNLSDTNFARRIEIKYPYLCRRLDNAHQDDSVNHDGDDDYHRYGYCRGHEGKTIGLIDRRPEGTLLGDWVIGGVPYITNAHTKFAPGDDFLTGERVKVEYVVLGDNTRLATKLKETDRDGGVSNPSHSLIVGFVDAKPEAFIGDWTINGAPFVAVSETIFIEHGSIFAVGSYVVVEYNIVNDQRIIIKILTYVPPGAGDDDSVGTLESVGAVVATAGMDVMEQDNEVWTVDGVDYIVSEATQIVDSGDDLAPGVTVSVNSYTEDGQRYATLIRTQMGQLMIPFAAR